MRRTRTAAFILICLVGWPLGVLGQPTEPEAATAGEAPASQPAEAQPGSQPAAAEEAPPPADDAAAKPPPPSAAPQGDEGVEILDISEDGIVFKDDAGTVVKVADFEELSLDKLLAEDIVVTGGKREQQAWATLSTVSAIDRQTIASSPYFFLGDLLATLPGLDVRWGKMQRMYVGTRGLSGTALNSRMLLLWDGLPLNDPFTGELSAGHFVPLVDVERIEVIRGAASTLYGANAFNGVVNVITGLDKIDQRVVRASLTGGSFLTSRAQAAFREPSKSGLAVAGSVEAFRSDGPFPQVGRRHEDQVDQIKNDDVRSISAAATASYAGLRLSGRYTYGERGRPGTFSTDHDGNILACDTCHNESSPFGQGIKYPATSTSCGTCHLQPTDREEVHRASVSLSYSRKVARHLKLSAYAYHNEWRTHYHMHRDEGFLRDSEIDRQLNQRSSGGEVHASHSYKKVNSVVLGAEVRRVEAAADLLVAPSGNSESQAEGAVFLEDELMPWRWLSITGGARVDYNTEFGVAVSPRGGLLLMPVEGLAIKGAVGRAFRNPSLSELYVFDNRGRYAVYGNLDLKREWITSVEGGVSYALANPLELRLSGTFYYNLASDLISFRSVASDRATFFNIDAVTAIGTEIEVSAQIRKNPNLNAYANYSYQHVRTEAGDELPYAPTHKVNVGVRAQIDRFAASLRVRFIDTRDDDVGITLPWFATLDGTAQYEVWNNTRLQLWVQNLAGMAYSESLGIPGTPRSVFVNLVYDNR